MKRRLLAVLLALVLAIVGTTSVLAYVNRADARALSGQQAMTAYVAAKDVPAGTTLGDALDEKLIVSEQLPKKTVPSDALTTVSADLKTEVARSEIAAGELVMVSRFGKELADTGGLPIPNGKMAVSVALEDPQRVGGYVQPGSEIAIFDTYNTLLFNNPNVPAGDGLQDGHGYNRATQLLLPRVSVLAVGQQVAKPQNIHRTQDGDNGQGTTQSTVVIVTVAVTQQEAEKLVQGIQTGHLYLGLLNSSSNVKPGNGVDNTNLFH